MANVGSSSTREAGELLRRWREGCEGTVQVLKLERARRRKQAPRLHVDRSDDEPVSGEKLQAYLQRAGWSPRELAHAVNGRLKRMADHKHQIHPTAPYHWLKHGYCPYAPVPEIVAEVLSERLGQPITPDMVWPGRTTAAPAMATA